MQHRIHSIRLHTCARIGAAARRSRASITTHTTNDRSNWMVALNGSVLSLTQIFLWLVIAVICGAVAQAILGYSHIGLLSATALGLLGALVGTWLANALRLPSILTINVFGVEAELLWCTVGAVLVIALTQSLHSRRGGGGGGPRPRPRRGPG